MLRSDLPKSAPVRWLWTVGLVLAALAPDALAQRRARTQVPHAPAPAPRAYVTNSSANTVSVIDTSSNLVVATIPVGAGPSRVAISPV